MSSTFFGLTIAGSGLNAFSASINTTANNVSNIDTEGYSKQVVNKEASSALRVFQKYGSTSTGVYAASVTRMRDEYYDEKYWNNEGDYGYYERKQYYMNQIEDYFNDKGATAPGFSTIFAEMFNSLESVNDAAGSSENRTTFISGSQKLATYFNQTANRLSDIQISINDEVKSTVDQINSIAQRIALLNQQINVIEMESGHANDLRDSRALLVDELSKIIKVDVSEEQVINSNNADMYLGGTTFQIKINGETLVDSYRYRTLSCVSRESRVNQSDVDGLYDIYWKDTLEYRDGKVVRGTGNPLNVMATIQTGSLKAMLEMRDGADGQNLHGAVVLSDDEGHTLSDSSKITVLAPKNMDEISEMNMPAAGTLTVNNTKLEYESFYAQYEMEEITIYELDANGERVKDGSGNYISSTIEVPRLYDNNGEEIGYDEYGFPLKGGGTPRVAYYTFLLKEGMSSTALSKLDGQAVVGSTIATKGIPYYQNQMNQFLRSFAKQFNDVHEQGQDLDGNPGEAFFVAKDATDSTKTYRFSGQQSYTNIGQREDSTESPSVIAVRSADGTVYTRADGKLYKSTDGINFEETALTPQELQKIYVTRIGSASWQQMGYSSEAAYFATGMTQDSYYQLTASSLVLNDTIVRDVTKMAATTNLNNGIDNNDLVDDLQALENKVKMFRGVTADRFLQTVYADVTVDAEESRVFSENFQNIQVQIEKQRQSVSGVDEDEEAMDLVKFQNAYNLSSKIISVLAEMYDQLILRTGV